MPDDRRAGNGRSLKATRAAPGAATAGSMKVRMKTTMAGPSGIRHPEEVVDLPKAEAKALIKAGAAVPVLSADTPAEKGDISGKDPFTDEKGRFGIDLDPFVKWIDPEGYSEAQGKNKPTIFAGERYPRDQANRRLRERLSEALGSGEYELRYLPLDNPGADWECVKPHRYPEIIKQISLGYSGIRKTFKLEGCDRPVPVRVFLRDGQAVDIAKTNYTELLRDLSVEQVVIIAGKELIKEGDKGGPGFPRRVYERMGSPKKPPFETVRKYVRKFFPDQK